MNTRDLFPDTFLGLTRQQMGALIDAGIGIRAAVLATTDGFEVAAAMQGDTDPARIAALASSIATIGSVATQEAGLGRCDSVILNTEAGFAVVRQLQHGPHPLVLIAVADRQSLLAQIMYQVNQCVKTLVDA